MDVAEVIFAGVEGEFFAGECAVKELTGVGQGRGWRRWCGRGRVLLRD
jgi:hypothetical protein